MSGNPTKNPASRICFLDTCVYINYGVHFDFFHNDCVRIFNASHMRHTSESVISEIENFKSFMSEFGRDLNIVLSRNKIKDLRKFREAMFQGYNENQGIFIKQFLEIVITRNEEVIVSEYRATRREVESKIGAVLETKTQKPLIPISKDQGFIDSLVCIEDEDDRQIVADAVLWATGYDSTIFCTSDSVHILTSSPAIKSTINSYYHKNCIDFKHVRDI